MIANRTTKGMTKEEKIGLALGAVAFIVVLLFFLVIGNMSFDATQATQPIQPSQPIQPAQPIQPVEPIEPEQSVQPVQPLPPIQPSQVPVPGVGMGELFITVGGLLLLVGLLYLARRFGWLYLEEVPRTHDEPKPELPKQRYERAPLLESGSSGHLDSQVKKLTRELERRQETIQRLAGERNKASQEIQLLRETLALDEEVFLTDAVKQLQGKLTTALKAKKELTARLRDSQSFREVTPEELEVFWPTLQLDKKPFMSKRRQQRLQARMRAENMKWVRIG